MDNETRRLAVVKWYATDKGFGVIRNSENQEVFIHYSGIFSKYVPKQDDIVIYVQYFNDRKRRIEGTDIKLFLTEDKIDKCKSDIAFLNKTLKEIKDVAEYNLLCSIFKNIPEGSLYSCEYFFFHLPLKKKKELMDDTQYKDNKSYYSIYKKEAKDFIEQCSADDILNHVYGNYRLLTEDIVKEYINEKDSAFKIKFYVYAYEKYPKSIFAQNSYIVLSNFVKDIDALSFNFDLHNAINNIFVEHYKTTKDVNELLSAPKTCRHNIIYEILENEKCYSKIVSVFSRLNDEDRNTAVSLTKLSAILFLRQMLKAVEESTALELTLHNFSGIDNLKIWYGHLHNKNDLDFYRDILKKSSYLGIEKDRNSLRNYPIDIFLDYNTYITFSENDRVELILYLLNTISDNRYKDVYFTLSEESQVYFLYYLARHYSLDNFFISPEECNSTSVKVLITILKAKNLSDDEKINAIYKSLRYLLDRINIYLKEDSDSDLTFIGLFHECNKPWQRYEKIKSIGYKQMFSGYTKYCEGKWWLPRGRETPTAYCPRLGVSCNDSYYKGKTSKNSIEKYYRSWTLYDAMVYSEMLNENVAGKISNLGERYFEIISKISGVINRYKEIKRRLTCRECKKTLEFNLKYSKYFFAAYSVTLAHCSNHDCSMYNKEIYFNHCRTYDCGAIIDSRDLFRLHPTDAPEGLLILPQACLYICNECGAANDWFTPGDLCPNCRHPHMLPTNSRKLKCPECDYTIIPPKQKKEKYNKIKMPAPIPDPDAGMYIDLFNDSDYINSIIFDNE